MVRVLVFFVLVFAGFLIPAGGIFLMVLLGPPPYVLNGEGPGAEWLEERAFPDGSRVLVRSYDTDGEAAQSARDIAGAIPTNFAHRTLDVTRYRRSDNDRYGLVLPAAEYVVHVEAASAEAVEARFQALGFVRENPQKNPLWVALNDRLPVTLAGIGFYAVLLGLAMSRGAAWAARVAPDAAAIPVPLSTLRNRLMEINRLGLPFQVTEVRSGRFVAEWRIVDAEWVGVMMAGGLRKVHRVHIDLDEPGRKARVLDRTHKVSWGAAGARLGFSLSFFQGIEFTGFERGRMVGLLFDRRTGWSIRDGYNYRFDVAEMKRPLIEAVTQSGWRWQPVMTFFRLIGG